MQYTANKVVLFDCKRSALLDITNSNWKNKENILKSMVFRALVLSVSVCGFLALSGPIRAASIVSGAVTGGSAFTAGGRFVELKAPWGDASSPANTVGSANFMTPNLYGFDEVQNFKLTAIWPLRWV
jgi:hypothetical protein